MKGSARDLSGLYIFDSEYRRDLEGFLCGVDEAGRGPLAGPVCAAAVILAPDTRFEGLNDSKQLRQDVRERLYGEITGKCVAFAAAMADNRVIDDINILQATMRAMLEAVGKLQPAPSLVLVDGNRAPVFQIPCVTVVKGDAKSASVAAASVIAKVTRDRYMRRMDALYPGYGFSRNMGYGTKEHLKALREMGPTPIHRVTFLHGPEEEEQTLFTLAGLQ